VGKKWKQELKEEDLADKTEKKKKKEGGGHAKTSSRIILSKRSKGTVGLGATNLSRDFYTLEGRVREAIRQREVHDRKDVLIKMLASRREGK